MCKPYILRVEYDDGRSHHEEFNGVGPAEVEGEAALMSDPNATSFAVYAITSRFKRVTRIENVPVKSGGGE